jgi:hypothetical protein
MLKIRSEQMKVFEPAAEEVFTRWLTDYIRREHVGEVVTLPDGSTCAVSELEDQALAGMVRCGIARARGRGMNTNTAASAFVTLMFVTSPNFDEHRIIRHILHDESISPDLRIERLFDVTTDGNWDAVVAGYDPAAWER